MAIDFPNTPATNDTFTSAGTTFKYDGIKWNIVTTSATATVGDKGGVKYTWSSTTTDADPGAGFVRYNNATIGSVTFIYIDDVDAGGNTQTAWYSTWDDSTSTLEDGFLIINENLGPIVNIFKINGTVTAAAGYYKIPVVFVSGTALADNDSITINFARSGDTGPSGTMSLGTTTTGSAGSSVVITNTGTPSAAIWNFTIPRGDTGLAATATAGTTTTGLPGTNASVANSGTTSAAVFDFTIPRGDVGGTPYTFSTTTTDADPGNGVVRYNNATIGSVTFLYIDNLDNEGNTQTSWYDSFDTSTSATKGIITLRQNGGAVINKFNVTGTVTVAAGYYKIPVTYISGTLPTNNAEVMVTFSSTGDQGESMITFAQTSTLSTVTGAVRYRFPFAATILGITTAVNTAPTGASIICDVNKNGTTVFTTQGNRPTIAVSTNASHTGTSEAVPDVTAIAAGDYLTVDIDQVGSTVAGSDLTVFIRYKRA